MDCRTLIAHPKLPILHVLTADGRVLVIAISVKVKAPSAFDQEEEEDDVFSEDSEDSEGRIFIFYCP